MFLANVVNSSVKNKTMLTDTRVYVCYMPAITDS